MTERDLERVKRAVIRNYPITSGIALADIKIELSTDVDTAAVVGEKDENGVIQVKCIQVNPEFFERLSFSERVFVLAHESLHIAFKHFSRSIKKPERDAQRKYEEYCEHESDPVKRKIMKKVYHKRYQNMWNIATDACINALLRQDGFTFPQNIIDPRTGKPMKFVDMEEGLHKCAEKIYDYLYRKQEEKEQEKEKKEEKNDDNDEKSDEGNKTKSNQGQPLENEKGDSSGGDEQAEEKTDSSGNELDGDESSEKQAGKPQKKKKEEIDSIPSLDDIDIDDYNGFDSHDSWAGKDSEEKKQQEETDEKKQQGEMDEKKQQKEPNEENEKSDDEEFSDEIDEEKIFKEEKRQKEKKEEKSLKSSLKKIRESEGLGEYEAVKPVISWKRLLTGTIEKTIEVWGNRRSSRYNPNARIEERTEESGAEVEVILDVSGSISVQLLRGFLLQLYPILEEMSEEDFSIKVGCFSTSFSGWQVIHNKNDIRTFSPKIGGGTDFEVASTSFTKDPGRKITKIVFTDGELGRPQTTRVPDIIWIVFGNDMDFTPLGGRIIRVDDNSYNNMISQSLVEELEPEMTTSIKKI